MVISVRRMGYKYAMIQRLQFFRINAGKLLYIFLLSISNKRNFIRKLVFM